jgi:hypothetical protein
MGARKTAAAASNALSPTATKGDAAAAKRYAEQAKAQYPSEAQAHHLSGTGPPSRWERGCSVTALSDLALHPLS